MSRASPRLKRTAMWRCPMVAIRSGVLLMALAVVTGSLACNAYDLLGQDTPDYELEAEVATEIAVQRKSRRLKRPFPPSRLKPRPSRRSHSLRSRLPMVGAFQRLLPTMPPSSVATTLAGRSSIQNTPSSASIQCEFSHAGDPSYPTSQIAHNIADTAPGVWSYTTQLGGPYPGLAIYTEGIACKLFEWDPIANQTGDELGSIEATFDVPSRH